MSSDDPTSAEQPTPRGRTHRRGRTRRRIVAGAVATLLAGAGAGALALSADAAPTVSVTVDAGTSLGTVPSTAVGLNTAVYDAYMNDARAASLMKAAGVRQLRFPGGSVPDAYHWKTHTVTGGSWAAPGTDFDHFMATAKKVGAQPIITANYGSGTAREAADWVKYANVDKHYGVTYWEIGNEVSGNGHYGSKWEVDTHADRSPREYAKNVIAYAKAMKAVDPKVRIGAVLNTPGSWPDGVKASGDDADWNNTVLSIAGKSIDFAIIHWYPGGSSTADLLNSPARIAGVTSAVRSLINKYAGSHAASVKIAVTETSSADSVAQTSQAAALFAPDTYMNWLEQGAVGVDWWDLHNGPGKPDTVQGQTDYQDGGVLSVGGCSGGTCEPARETPFPTYWGIRSLTALAHPGDTMVKASSGDPSIAVHAVRSGDGGLNVMLINKNPRNAAHLSLSYTGYTPAAGAVRTVSYTKGGTALAKATRGTAAAQTLPPYSITTLQLKPSSAAARTGSPSPAPTPTTTAAAPVASAPGTIGTRAQATAVGAPPAGPDRSHTAGGLATTGLSSTVTYGTLGGLLAVAAGWALMLRRRRGSRGSHSR
ncbi:cellulose-binding protein [Streptomyces beihaiensis]|uniref:Cellulose-binding protein n=1 Tax=Streptomyces beihaiensis TaxID=2984495 RepID=A0ABT3U3C0_9ACTN|nr:cellulose-binding protein [Streptomyces beihaiensis]MCX3063779.1 cellulose-binding protein [Streptomyces beihaiensis]